MTTRDKILVHALKLFNKKGLTNVSIRDIASDMGISDGNLRYHFRTRDSLVDSLFDQLVERIGKELYGGMNREPDAKFLLYITGVLMESFYAYRFFLQDLVHVLATHPGLRKKFHQITNERLLVMKQMLEMYIQKGYLKSEPYPGDYEKLIQSMLIVSHFWLNGSQLFYKGPQKQMVKFYTETVFSLINPYLTEKAIRELYS